MVPAVNLHRKALDDGQEQVQSGFAPAASEAPPHGAPAAAATAWSSHRCPVKVAVRLVHVAIESMKLCPVRPD
jgi:hypothetical protein